MKNKHFFVVLIVLLLLPLTTHAEDRYLYDVLKNETESGGLAREYTGEHHDSFTEEPTHQIYHWYADNSDEGTTVANKNNVLYADYCWQIVRTTDTGGTKLLYSGKPQNGKCNNTGDNLGIKKSKYNSSSNYLSYVGYMYNAKYKVNLEKPIYGAIAGNSVEWINNQYVLKNTTTNLDDTHHFTCNTTSDTCSKVRYYYTGYSYKINYYSYIELQNGETVENALNKMLSASDINRFNSDIKIEVDSWYKENMVPYTNELENTIFCNDRQLTDIGGFEPNHSLNTSGGLKFHNGLVCEQETDKFSVDNNKAKLKYPIALISYYETTMIKNINALNGNPSYSTMTPSGVLDNEFLVHGAGIVNNETLIRPVISLNNSAVVLYGNGTKDNPYVVNKSAKKLYKDIIYLDKKTDVWNKTFGIIPNSNKDYIVSIVEGEDASLLKLKRNGETIWKYDIKDLFQEYSQKKSWLIKDFVLDEDDNIYALATAFNEATSTQVSKVCKFNDSGSLIKCNSLPNNGDNYLSVRKIVYKNNKIFYTFYEQSITYSNRVISGVEYNTLVRLDKDLTEEKSIMYSSKNYSYSSSAYTESEEGYSSPVKNIVFDSNNNIYVIADNYFRIQSPRYGNTIVKIDSNFNKIKEYTINSANELYRCNAIEYVNDNTLLVSVSSGANVSTNESVTSKTYLMNLTNSTFTKVLDNNTTSITKLGSNTYFLNGKLYDSSFTEKEESQELINNTSSIASTFNNNGDLYVSTNNTTTTSIGYALKNIEDYSISIIQDPIVETNFEFDNEDIDSVFEGENVVFRVSIPNGYELKTLFIKNSDDETIEYQTTSNDNEYSFIMPDSDVVISPSFEKIKSSINVEIVNETEDVNIELNDVTSVEVGEEVEFKVKPIYGYVVNDITITGDNGEEITYTAGDNPNEYTFTMPEYDVTITPTYERKKSKVIPKTNTPAKEFKIEVADAQAVVYEDEVKFTVIPEDSYEVSKIDIIDEDDNYIDYHKTGIKNEYQFKMPGTDVEITPYFEEINLVNPQTGNIKNLIILISMAILILCITIYYKKINKKAVGNNL